MIREEIEYRIDKSIFLDSTCVLRYVEKDEKGYETFVANRVSAIREQPLPSQWRYVQTELNPADYACEKYLLTTSLSLHMDNGS